MGLVLFLDSPRSQEESSVSICEGNVAESEFGIDADEFEVSLKIIGIVDQILGE
jgi:hypothetical protein